MKTASFVSPAYGQQVAELFRKGSNGIAKIFNTDTKQWEGAGIRNKTLAEVASKHPLALRRI